MFDAHAWYIRDVIMDCIDVPDSDGRLADMEDRIAREDAGKDLSHLIRYKGEYIKEMIADTDYPSFDVDGAIEAFFQWKKYTDKEDIVTFRDHCRSVMTDNMAPMRHTPWKDDFDDSSRVTG